MGNSRLPAHLLFAFASVLVFVVDSLPAEAQIIPGQRIRATLANGGQVIGLVTAVSADSVTLAPDSEAGRTAFPGQTTTVVVTGRGLEVAISRSDIRGLEISTGIRREWKKGLMYGAAIGAGLGVLQGITYECCILVWVIVDGASGAATGAALGYYFLSGETWSPVLARSAEGAYRVGVRIPLW